MTRLYKDTLHGFKAKSSSKSIAFMLIRNKCKEQQLEIPTFDMIVELENRSNRVK